MHPDTQPRKQNKILTYSIDSVVSAISKGGEEQLEQPYEPHIISRQSVYTHLPMTPTRLASDDSK